MKKLRILILGTLLAVPCAVRADGVALGNDVLLLGVATLTVPFLAGHSPKIYAKHETYSYWTATALGIGGMVLLASLGNELGTTSRTVQVQNSDGSYSHIRKTEWNGAPALLLGTVGMLGGNALGYLWTRHSKPNWTLVSRLDGIEFSRSF